MNCGIIAFYTKNREIVKKNSVTKIPILYFFKFFIKAYVPLWLNFLVQLNLLRC